MTNSDMPEFDDAFLRRLKKTTSRKTGAWRRRFCRTTRGFPAPPRKRITLPEDLEAAVLKEGFKVLRQLRIPAFRQQAGKVMIGDRWMHLAPAGAADITGILPDGIRLECEAKKRYGGIQSKEQKEFEKMIIYNNGEYVLFHSGQELMEKLQLLLTKHRK